MPDYDPSTFSPQGPHSLNSAGFLKEYIDFLGGQIGIDFPHHEVHEGNLYTFGYTFIDVANAASAELHFVTAATHSIHYAVRITSEGKSYAFIYRGSTYTDDGTEITPVNNNCASSNTAATTVYHTPTVNVDGTLLTAENGILIAGGLGPQSVGSDVRSNDERVAAVSNDYLVRVTNVAGTDKDITIQVAGYEVAV
jgi:hypothetical protein